MKGFEIRDVTELEKTQKPQPFLWKLPTFNPGFEEGCITGFIKLAIGISLSRFGTACA